MTIYRSQCTFRLLGKTAKYEQEVNELKQELSTIRYFFNSLPFTQHTLSCIKSK